MPTQSAILPAATGKVSHVRIIIGERSPEKARYSFEIFKERIS